jgi:hypothetical protein
MPWEQMAKIAVTLVNENLAQQRLHKRYQKISQTIFWFKSN